VVRLAVLGASLIVASCGFINNGPVAHADLVLRIVNLSSAPTTTDWTPAGGKTQSMTVGGCHESAQGLDAGTYAIAVHTGAARADTVITATKMTDGEVTQTILVGADGSINLDGGNGTSVEGCASASP